MFLEDKWTYWYKILKIFDIPTKNPPTHKIIVADKELIEGKFYQPELLKVLEKEGLKLKCLTILKVTKIQLVYHWFDQPDQPQTTLASFQILKSKKSDLQGE